VVFVESKADSLCSLITQGQRTLAFLNAREVAFAALVVRRQKAVVLVARKKEAFSFLKKQPLGLWANQDKIAATQVWLTQRGVSAIAHLERRAKAFKLLQVRLLIFCAVPSCGCLTAKLIFYPVFVLTAVHSRQSIDRSAEAEYCLHGLAAVRPAGPTRALCCAVQDGAAVREARQGGAAAHRGRRQ
jgi:hypothetical protein